MPQKLGRSISWAAWPRRSPGPRLASWWGQPPSAVYRLLTDLSVNSWFILGCSEHCATRQAHYSSARPWPRRRCQVAHGPTWGCGYAAPTPRMQYTSSSFAQMLVALFAWALRPRLHKPAHLPLFPAEADFHSTVPDTVLEEAVLPAFRFGAWL